MELKENKISYYFDLIYDCKSEKEVKDLLKYLESQVRKYNNLKDDWDEYIKLGQPSDYYILKGINEI